VFAQYVVDLSRSDREMLCFVPVLGDITTPNFTVEFEQGVRLAEHPEGECLGMVFQGGTQQDIQRWFEDADQYFCYRYAMADHLQPEDVQARGYIEP
jgi:hypothetical protein